MEKDSKGSLFNKAHEEVKKNINEIMRKKKQEQENALNKATSKKNNRK